MNGSAVRQSIQLVKVVIYQSLSVVS